MHTIVITLAYITMLAALAVVIYGFASAIRNTKYHPKG